MGERTIRRTAQKERKKERSLRDRTMDQIKRRNERSFDRFPILDTSNYEDVNWFKPKKGINKIRILSYIAGPNHPELEEGLEDYKLDIEIHTGLGPSNAKTVCLNKMMGQRCPPCEERSLLLESGDYEYDDKIIKDLSTTRRCWYNVLDLDEKEKGVQIWGNVSFANFERRLLSTAEEDYDEVIIFGDLDEGAEIRFKGVEKKFGKVTYMDFENFSLHPIDSLKESLREKIYPLDEMLKIPTYEEVQNLMNAGSEEGEQQEEKDPNEQNETSSFSRKSKNVEEEKEPIKEEDESENEESSDGECPCGLRFGYDNGTTEACQSECADSCYEKCFAKYDELEKSGDLKEPEPEPEPPKTNRPPLRKRPK